MGHWGDRMAVDRDEQGFIRGIFNYCDRWCERCPLASQCRTYAMEMSIQIDGVDGELTQAAKGLREDPAEGWAGEDFLAEAEDALSNEELAQERLARDVADVIVETHPLAVEADRLADLAGPLIKAADARVTAGGQESESYRLPLEVLSHYRYFVAAKVHRALSGREDPPIPGYDDEHPFPSDADGSAKVASLACDAARDAAKHLADLDSGLAALVARFVQTVGRVLQLIDETFPGHRTFRRPGFDDPPVVGDS